MRWETWSVFVVMETVLCLTPGPAVLLVLSQALARGARKSVWSSCGILAANGIYFLLSATGVGALLAASPRLFLVIKWVGAAYLIYLGASAFFGKTSVLASPEPGSAEATGGRSFLNGLILQISNPSLNICSSTSILEVAGPMVATILVRLNFFINIVSVK